MAESDIYFSFLFGKFWTENVGEIEQLMRTLMGLCLIMKSDGHDFSDPCTYWPILPNYYQKKVSRNICKYK